MRRYALIALVAALLSISYWMQTHELDIDGPHSASTPLKDISENSRSSTVSSSVSFVPVIDAPSISARRNSPVDFSSVNSTNSPRENTVNNVGDFSRYMSDFGGSIESFREDIQRKFEMEEVDDNWAYEYESKIKDMFIVSQELNNFVPDSIVCKTNRCQVVMHALAADELVLSADAFEKSLYENSSGLYKSEILAIPDFDEKIVVLYIAKNGEAIYQ